MSGINIMSNGSNMEVVVLMTDVTISSDVASMTSESTGCGSASDEEDDLPQSVHPDHCSEDRFSPNIDLRYGGQYLTPEQLPMFCDQLHHLVEVIRNIQAYAEVTGEYPASLERRLEHEARSVAALAAESRHARDVIVRTRVQRRALRDYRAALLHHLAELKDTEMRELENTVRMSDRKLYKSWECLKDSNDPAAFEPLLEEIRNKQTALECLVQLIEGRRASISKNRTTPQPLPPPLPKDVDAESASARRRSRRGKRRRREPRSVPLSSEPSAHQQVPQVTLYIQGSEPRRRSVPASPLDLPSAGSVRDILFFTTNA